MTDFVSWVTSVLTIEIATVGTVTVTLGLMIAASMIFAFGLRVARRLRGLG